MSRRHDLYGEGAGGAHRKGPGDDDNHHGDEYVEFYHDDGRCDPSQLLIKVRVGTSANRCEILAPTVRDSVWGIKIEGRCSDVPDVDFLTACTRYASTKKLGRAQPVPQE